MLYANAIIKILYKKSFQWIIYNYIKYIILILGDPGADSGDEGKSKRAEKYGTKKSKERRVLAPIRSQNGGDCWNWTSKTLSPGALLAVLYFSSCHIFPPV